MERTNPDLVEDLLASAPFRDNFLVEANGTVNALLSRVTLFDGDRLVSHLKTDDLYWGRCQSGSCTLSVLISALQLILPGVGYAELLPTPIFEMIKQDPDGDLALQYRRFVRLTVLTELRTIVMKLDEHGSILELPPKSVRAM